MIIVRPFLALSAFHHFRLPIYSSSLYVVLYSHSLSSGHGRANVTRAVSASDTLKPSSARTSHSSIPLGQEKLLLVSKPILVSANSDFCAELAYEFGELISRVLTLNSVLLLISGLGYGSADLIQQGISEKVALSAQFLGAFATGFIRTSLFLYTPCHVALNARCVRLHILPWNAVAYARSWRLSLAMTSILPCIAITGAIMQKFVSKYKRSVLIHPRGLHDLMSFFDAANHLNISLEEGRSPKRSSRPFVLRR